MRDTHSTIGAYLLIDASQSFDIYLTLEGLCCDYHCLITGLASSGRANSLPYLVGLEANSSATEWYFDAVYGKNWGILISAQNQVEELTRDLKKFVRCNYLGIPNTFFRFYRPKTFHTFVQALSLKDQDSLLKNHVFYAEAADGKRIKRYYISGGKLNIENLSKQETFDQITSRRRSLA
jgi:Domain of unknown function (DUF4123)